MTADGAAAGRPARFVAGSDKRLPRKYVRQESRPKPKVQGFQITYCVSATGTGIIAGLIALCSAPGEAFLASMDENVHDARARGRDRAGWPCNPQLLARP
jgi:hypothetical protein